MIHGTESQAVHPATAKVCDLDVLGKIMHNETHIQIFVGPGVSLPSLPSPNNQRLDRSHSNSSTRSLFCFFVIRPRLIFASCNCYLFTCC